MYSLGCKIPFAQSQHRYPLSLFGQLSNMAGMSTQVPKVRVGYTNYPGINLQPVNRMPVIELVNNKELHGN